MPKTIQAIHQHAQGLWFGLPDPPASNPLLPSAVQPERRSESSPESSATSTVSLDERSDGTKRVPV